jgi:hypothetical protein
VARIDDYRESFRLASEELQKVDLQKVARLAGVPIQLSETGISLITLTFLGNPYMVEVSDGVTVMKEGDAGEVPLPEKILFCHYLLHASGEPLTGQLITFRQIPDGHFYFDAFQRRARDPLLSAFGRNVDLFRTCAESLGGKPVAAGDIGMAFDVLPRIPVHLVLWRGDDEFPPEASVLFDKSIQYNLAVEDIAVLSGMLVYRLMAMARNKADSAAHNG